MASSHPLFPHLLHNEERFEKKNVQRLTKMIPYITYLAALLDFSQRLGNFFRSVKLEVH